MFRLFHSLRFRLAVVVILALLPAFGLAIFNAAEQRRHIEFDVQDHNLDIAQSLANHQKDLVEGARQMLYVLAQLPVIRGDDASACTIYLAELKENNPRYMNILKFDTAGNLLCDASNSPLPHKLPFLEHLYEVLQTRDFSILNYVVSPHTGERALSFGYPLLGEQGQPLAILIAAVNLDSFSELLSQVDLPPGAAVTLRDRDGIVLGGYPNPENWVGQLDRKIELVPQLATLEGEGTLVTEGINGELRLYAYTPVYSPTPEELYLILGVPYEVSMAEVYRNLELNLLILGGAGVIALLAIGLGGELLLLRPMQKLLGVTRQMTNGDLTTRTGLGHVATEVNELALSIDQMAEALEKRENERRRTQEVLVRQEHDRVRLLHKLITANEDERMRVAHELHDETSQNITALMLGLDTAGMALQKDPGRASEYFEQVKSISQELLDGIHRLVYNLRPSLLDDLGLAPAITLTADKLLKPQGIDLHLYVDDEESRLPPFIETTLFRIVQEAFTNIIRHSNARNVELHLTHTDHTLDFVIQDDGQGFDPTTLTGEPPAQGFGLRGMQERVDMLNGQFEIETQPGMGTRINIQIPIPETEAVHD